MDIDVWLDQMQSLLAQLRSVDLGYPLGDNRVITPPNPVGLDAVRTIVTVPKPLADLYSACDGVSLPDINVGYFVHSTQQIYRGLARGEPRRVRSLGMPIIVFGSNGGGGLFALSLDGSGHVVYLPPGEIRDSVYLESDNRIKSIASDLGVFLEYMALDVAAVVHRSSDWQFRLPQ